MRVVAACRIEVADQPSPGTNAVRCANPRRDKARGVAGSDVGNLEGAEATSGKTANLSHIELELAKLGRAEGVTRAVVGVERSTPIGRGGAVVAVRGRLVADIDGALLWVEAKEAAQPTVAGSGGDSRADSQEKDSGDDDFSARFQGKLLGKCDGWNAAAS